MSLESEKIAAQEAAFSHKPSQPWHRHLIGPVELGALFEARDEMHALREALEQCVTVGNKLAEVAGCIGWTSAEYRETLVKAEKAIANWAALSAARAARAALEDKP